MAANMQHMAGAGQMMQQQQMRKANNTQLQQVVYQNLVQHTQPFTTISWQSNVSILDRMGKTMNLITNIALAMNGFDYIKSAEYGCQFERETFHNSPTKEAYEQEMSNKIMEFLKRRQANEPGIQNALNANAQAQAQAQAQAHAMMNMQMGRGMGQGPQQGFQPMQHPMQGGQMGQQQQPQQMQMNMGMGMNMGMANQAGRGMGPNQQMMGMPGGPNRPQQASFPQEMARLSPQDKAKVAELAQKMMNTASEQQKANTRMQLSQRLSPQQLAEFQAQGKDPLMWFYQNQAFQVLKASMTRMQQQNSQQGMAQNPNNPQAAMMQQQASQQSLRQQQGQQQQSQQSQQPQQQQQQGMMNGGQGGNGFAPFTPNMDGIKDQQMDGLMAQQAGQMVVPASAGPNRNPTPQPMGQNMPNQQGPNQGPRPPQQQQQLQQMKMNQAQQSQAQLQAQAQMKQMQGQPGMGGNMQPAQSPAMNTLNTPVSRPPNNMNPMGNQTVGQGGVQFGDQRFNQGAQRPNNQAFQNMLASLPQEQRATISGLSPDKLNEVMQRWQSRRQEQIGLNAGQGTPGQMANRPQGQMNQMNPNMGGQMPTGMQQPGGPMNGNQQQMAMPRIPQNPQAIAMMDSLDLPPQVLQQLNQVPADIKKWGQLKIWLNQNNIPQQVRSQLAAIQQKQFQLTLQRRSGFMAQQQAQQQQQGQQQQQAQPQQPPQQQTQPQMPQPGQAANANPAMQTPGGAGPGAAMQAMRSQMPPNFPPQLLQVTAQDIAQVRQSRPNLSNVTDEQLRMMVIQMKKQAWIQQQQMRNQQAQVQAQAQAQARAQGQNQAQGQQGAQNQMGVPQAQMQLQQPNQTPQQQNMQVPNGMGQNVTPQGNGQKQPSATPEQTRGPRQQPANNRPQPPNPSPASAPKNLKRPSNDDSADVVEVKKPAPTRPASQPNQQQQQQPPQQQPQGQKQPTPQQIAGLTPEQRAKYEQFMRMQLANKANQPQADIMERLKAIGQEEQRQSSQEPVTDIPMSPEEYNDTSAKLTKIVVDMGKIGRGLKKWYTITRDDARARMFFRTRWRILKQFSDGEKMSVPRETFSIRGSDIDQARAMLESMAKDLAASVYARNMGRPPSQQQGTPQTQNAQLAQQQQQVPQQQQQPQQQPQAQAQGGQPAPLNAENLRRNSQAQANSKGANKANQVPNAPVATQPPFQFGASSPHGNPSYVGKPKDINLQLPPSRKKQKTTGQTPQGATPSPQISKKSSPEMRRASESQAPAKPVILCKEPECEHSTVGFPSEQALQYHVQEEHTKPREDPKKFVQENLALALGLEPDGSMKKELKTEAVPMSMTNSKQGQTPATMAATPMSTDGAMKRSASSMGKLQDSKTGIKAGATPKLADAKAPDATGAMDPWANSTIDPQSLMSNLGLENGVGFNNFTDLTLYRSATPNDTPESAKDSGASEPNSDISEGVSLEIDFDWANLDTDLLLNMNNANLDGNMGPAGFGEASLDPAMLLEPSGPPPDWDDIQTDFSKPFQFDTSHYFMATS